MMNGDFQKVKAIPGVSGASALVIAASLDRIVVGGNSKPQDMEG